jgi:cytochrome c peroxidase
MSFVAGMLFLAAALQAATVTIPLGLDLYLPVPEDSSPTAETIEAGRRLFFDRRLSRDGLVACASCHQPERAFSDGRNVAVGVFGRRGRRNTPSLINLAYATRLFWDARATSLEEQVVMPIEHSDEMDLPLVEAAKRVSTPAAAISQALATYVRSILAGNSRYDRFVAGDRDALHATERAGLELFRGKARCTSCHAGSTFSDNALHNTGVAWHGDAFSDEGGGQGRFRTPTLRELSRTAPYMHDGSVATLDDVIDYYDRGGNRHAWLDPQIRPLGLSPGDKAQLKAFLLSLNGTIIEGQPLR